MPISKPATNDTSTSVSSSPNKNLPLSTTVDFTNYAVDYSLVRADNEPRDDPLDDLLLLDLPQLPPQVLAPTNGEADSPNDRAGGDFLEEIMNVPLFHM